MLFFFFFFFFFDLKVLMEAFVAVLITRLACLLLWIEAFTEAIWIFRFFLLLMHFLDLLKSVPVHAIVHTMHTVLDAQKRGAGTEWLFGDYLGHVAHVYVSGSGQLVSTWSPSHLVTLFWRILSFLEIGEGVWMRDVAPTAYAPTPTWQAMLGGLIDWRVLRACQEREVVHVIASFDRGLLPVRNIVLILMIRTGIFCDHPAFTELAFATPAI